MSFLFMASNIPVWYSGISKLFLAGDLGFECWHGFIPLDGFVVQIVLPLVMLQGSGDTCVNIAGPIRQKSLGST